MPFAYKVALLLDPHHEMTLRQFVESTWFKFLARGAAVVGTMIAGAATAYFFTLDTRVSAIEATGKQRMVQTDNHLDRLDEKMLLLSDELSKIGADTSSTKIDVATMKGILQEMQRRQDVADRQTFFPTVTVTPGP